jgi:alginate O-acetyltransferase complex protein AlgI
MLAVSPVGSASVLLAAQIYTPASLSMMALCALLAFHPLETHDWVESLSWPRAVVLVPVLALAIISMFTQAFNPFLYFQF